MKRASIAVLDKLQNRIGPRLSELRLQAGLHAFAPRPDDIFAVSYPKSGTTLMQMMLYQMTTDGDMDFPHICAVAPHFELELSRGHMQPLQGSSPRIFKSHLKYKDMPHHGKHLYLVRDVRDVALSAYHHENMILGVQQNLAVFMDRFIAGKTRFGSWFEHVESWWPHRDDGNILFLRYEDIIADVEGTVRKVAGFCGLQVREEDMPRIVERCSLPFMKQHGDKFDPRLRRFSGGPGEFIRKGQSGGGSEVMSGEQRQRLAQQLETLERKLAPSQEDPLGALLRSKAAD